MKKRYIIMGSILFFVIIPLTFLIGICIRFSGLRGLFDNLRSDYTIYTCGDFDYIVIEDDGEQKAAIKSLSEEGKNKQVIVMPEYLDEYKVYGLYDQSWSSKHGSIHNNQMKLYINFEFKNKHNKIHVNKLFTLNPSYISKTRVSSDYYYTYLPISIDVSTINNSTADVVNNANVTYYSNYGDNNIYWIDDYDEESLITYIPENPVREGYEFDGWYKEAECINKWDFESDIVPGKNYYKNMNYFVSINNTYQFYQMSNYDYVETKLYAKWNELE